MYFKKYSLLLGLLLLSHWAVAQQPDITIIIGELLDSIEHIEAPKVSTIDDNGSFLQYLEQVKGEQVSTAFHLEEEQVVDYDPSKKVIYNKRKKWLEEQLEQNFLQLDASAANDGQETPSYNFSTPVLSKDKKTAVCYVREKCGPQCSYDSVYIYSRVNGVWKLQETKALVD